MLKRLGLALGISLCVTSVATVVSAAEVFRVLSYNVENLWDDEPDNTPDTWSRFLATLPDSDRDNMGRRYLQYSDYAANSSNWHTPKILEAKIQHFLEVVRWAHEPDILAIQEVESAGNRSHVFDMRGTQSVLREEFEKLGYRYFILGRQKDDNPVSVTPAIISKLPLKELESVTISDPEDPYSTSARDIQVVEFRDGANRMLIFNNHWKSKRGSPAKSEATRVKTAKILRQRIMEERQAESGTRIIVAGDLNSSYYEAPIKVLATSDETTMIKSRSSPLLYNLWYELGEDDRWETSFRGERQTLSAMLISDDFYNKDGIQYLDQSFQVVGQTGEVAKHLLNADGTPFRWQIRKKNKFTTHIGKGYSDHLPLVASFQIANTKLGMSGKKSLTHTSRIQKTESERPEAKLDKVILCSKEETVEITEVDFQSENWFNQCVKIEGEFPLEAARADDYNFIRLSRNLELTIAMTRSWDERPNIDDSRVQATELSSKIKYSKRNGHPRSNKCYARKVLRGYGGKLQMAIGRLGYYEGRMALFVPTREAKDLVLNAMPENKRSACPWDR